ncbi:23S rRNA (guanosine(2251)-2'-O)-methyltransferase RlmB [Geothermobacter hydrogeniphilus]|uniref:23S rRNA (Guanosine(2251)-2'-O)-methyltransferase RlmB n=1 Tax=Geothermobacter hydrogeniphilus TaxID=1969733 RepID=A0A1X0YDD2_9BACT|nr:23S rRNA (guanosine(2251)-2'-O)-methyltransferase RlmB [Geothermobacter hydrogeniphilus]ORJ63112.1 23S rRNA (guanosine(2251)-2'-O)-methyltransferase RlmB [Geothermobacter hydrogeniphilus]
MSGDDLIYGINPVREALQAGQREPRRLMLRQGVLNPRLEEIASLAADRGVPCRRLTAEEFERLCGPARHQGVALYLAPFAYLDFTDLLAAVRSGSEPPFILLLDSITDPHNFGAILRSAEAAGCQGVVVARDRSCPVSAIVDKTSAGALEHLPLCRVTNLARTIDQLKDEGIWVYALAGEAGADDLYRSNLSGPVAIVVGSEGSGVRPNVRRHCDGLLALPMKGRVSSLNASVAAALALYEVVRQREVGT